MATPRPGASPLELYGHNLTRPAREGARAPLAGQEGVTSQVVQVLSRKHKCCPMILDADAKRLQEIVLAIARQMAAGEAGESFAQKQMLALDFAALFSQLSEETPMRQQQRARVLLEWKQRPRAFIVEGDEQQQQPSPALLEQWVDRAVVLERLRSVITALRQAEGAFILFIDHFQRFVYGRDEYSIDASSVLVPALARRQIALIGACSPEAYQQHITRDPLFRTRFQAILLREGEPL